MLTNAKTAIIVIAASLVGLVLILIALLIVLDKDPTTYVGSLTTLIGVLASSGILAAMIGKQNDKVRETKEKTEQIAKSVNGNTTKLLDENALLRARVAEYEANRSAGAHSAELMSEDTISRIKSDSDALTGPTPVLD